MIQNCFSRIGLVTIVLLIFGCDQKEESATGEQKSKIKEAVEGVVTREFKIYEKAKKSLKKIEKEAQEKREKALKQ